jgi:hypothetical protein
LQLANVLGKEGGKNITELNLSRTKMIGKAGIFIGEALLKNPNYPIQQILFKDVNLGQDGLYRLLLGVNIN